ncbi:TetR/AcrR family transcriptional regulator [Advenella mimigardefordensis]|uniref:Transcriptional regulator, TetR family n=1 Tax=Advenella mimigardefordensis (strain DSM 17166 / LMG 22922 / DPN7) TaxID=1247726 RepID=W0PID9_ADVMD|nr:TetR/AcrR family transcriptional regulator [Advenella mimigardefordensis]AHG65662.1 transcriptional regulator, TetR family [Advenella mimigardefordensis DPN7]
MATPQAIATDSSGQTLQQRILKTAAQLFATHGFHAVGMQALCDALQISRGAFYHHFRSKDDVLDDICTRYMTELVHKGLQTLRDESDPERCLQRLGQDLLEVIATNLPELTVCFREIQSLGIERRQKVIALHRKYESLWKETVERGAQTGVLLPYSRTRMKAVLGMYYYSYLWLNPARADELAGAIESFNDITLKGLRK